jgi:hypothetical protein
LKHRLKAKKQVHLPVPMWVGVVYGLFCVVLIPWTIYLSATLPTHVVAAHWDASWVGLDSAIALSLLATALLTYRKSRWVVVASTISGSFLLVDAWFDVTSARPGYHFDQAMVLALFVELPITLMSFAITYHVLARNIRHVPRKDNE